MEDIDCLRKEPCPFGEAWFTARLRDLGRGGGNAMRLGGGQQACTVYNVTGTMAPPGPVDAHVVKAFTHATIEEEIYMAPPEGYAPKDGKVCRLRKGVEGLKQGANGFMKLNATVIGREGAPGQENWYSGVLAWQD